MLSLRLRIPASAFVLLLCIACSPTRAQEPSTLSAALALEQSVVDAIALAERSVVAIARYRKDSPAGEMTSDPWNDGDRAVLPVFGERAQIPDEFAAGVVIDRHGYILTNYHVLGNPDQNRYVVMVGRRPLDVVRVMAVQQVQAGDPWTDLAVLKVEADDLQPITFGDARTLRKGQFVVSLGNPFNIARDGEVCAGWGIVSNLGRKIPYEESGAGRDRPKELLYHYGGLIQTDARLNMGTSGGPLINLRGEMIGLTTAMASLEGFEKSMGYAIPVDQAFKKTVETLKSGHKAEFGFLGVAPRDLSNAMRRGGHFGVAVEAVVPSTPAAEAGLRQGDIITRLNDQPLYDSDGLMCELGKMPAGADVRLTVERGANATRKGRVFLTSAVLSKKHMPHADRAYAQQPDPRWRGMSVDYATAALPPALLQQALQTGAPAGTLAVSDVQQNSAAWKAGLRSGTLLTHVDGRRVTTPAEFYAAVESQAGDVELRLTNATTREVVVSPQ